MPDDLHQPVSDLQLKQLVIEWVPYGSIHPNRYNPNRMSWHDRQLLKQSLLEDGWTQPIVTLLDGTIVDGEQRWTTAGMPLQPAEIQAVIAKMEKRQAEGAAISESIMERLRISIERLEAAIAEGGQGCIAAITGGLVPVTRVDFKDDAHKMISTIRHNRARGTHQIDSMAVIAQDLVQLGLDFDDLETRLGMMDDEIERLLDAANGLGEAEALLEETQGEFSQSWSPVHITELSPEAGEQIVRSQAAAQTYQQHQDALRQREQTIKSHVEAQVAEAEASGETLTQDRRAEIAQQAARSIPVPEKPKPPVLKKIQFFVTPEEYDIVIAVLGDHMATTLVEMCRGILEQRQSRGEPAPEVESLAA